MLRTFWCCLFSFVVFCSTAQTPQNQSWATKGTGADDNLNRKDHLNRKQGMWFLKVEALRGEPAYMTFGTYKDDLKEGLWYKLDREGQLMSIENFKHDLLDRTSQYFEEGRLVLIGNYKSIDRIPGMDSIWVTNPITLYDTLVAVPKDKSCVRHGVWRYYDAHSGQLTREEIYQMDYLLRRKDFTPISPADSIYIQKRIENLPHNRSSGDSKKQQPKGLFSPKIEKRP